LLINFIFLVHTLAILTHAHGHAHNTSNTKRVKGMMTKIVVADGQVIGCYICPPPRVGA